MQHLRRRFLHQLSLAAAALAFGKVQAASRLGTIPVSKAGLGCSAFLPLVGHDFSVARATALLGTLRLVEVARLPNPSGYPDPAKALEQCFTLVFEAQTKVPLAEGMYTLSAGKFVPFDAFMSPIRGDGRSYQVVFNRI
jgi:hypothetical protein